MSALASILGHFLSQYDETAMQGVSVLVAAVKADPTLVDRFIQDRQILDAFLKLFKRQQCDFSALYGSLPFLLESATKANATLLAFTISTNSAVIHQFKRDLDHVTDNRVLVLSKAVAALSAIVPFAAESLLNRLGGGTVPLHLVLFQKELTHIQTPLAEVRTGLLASLFSSQLKPTILPTLIRGHGFLSHLFQDLPELTQQRKASVVLAQGEGEADRDTVMERRANLAKYVLEQFRFRFLYGDDFTPLERQKLIGAQQGVMKSLVKLLGVDAHGVASSAAETLRALIPQVKEPSEDYILRKEGENSRMPNFLLFSLLRMLRPRRRLVDIELLSSVLEQVPDLYRPYVLRASHHLIAADDDGRSSAAQTLGIMNTITRLLLVPVPFHISSGSASLLPLGLTPLTFYQLSPAAVADEIAPVWLSEYLHKTLAQGNILFIVWVLQVAQAATNRAMIIRSSIESMSGVEEEEKSNFLAAVDAILLERFPKREELWHRVTQQWLPKLNPTLPVEQTRDQPKVQFVLQRCWLLMLHYTDLFHLRHPWLSAIPAPVSEWRGPLPDYRHSFASWSPESVSVVCSLLVANLRTSVKLSKLHHITFAGERKAGETIMAPPLLELLLWYDEHRSSSSSVRGLFAIARLTLWIIHSFSLRFAATLPEVTLWLQHLTPKTMPLFIHVLNAVQQQGLSKAADRVMERLLAGEFGFIHTAAIGFVERTEEKFAASQQKKAETQAKGSGGNNKSGANAQDVWQLDMRANLPNLQRVIRLVSEQWKDREQIFTAQFGSFVQRNDDTTAMRSRHPVATALGITPETQQTSVEVTSASFARLSPVAQFQRACSGADIPAPVNSHWAQILPALNFAVLHEKLIQPYQFRSGAGLIPWMNCSYVNWRVVSRLVTVEAQTDASQGFCTAILAEVLENSSKLVAEWAVMDEATKASVATLIFASLADVNTELFAPTGLFTNHSSAEFETLLMKLYSATAVFHDRALYASLAFLWKLSRPQRGEVEDEAADSQGEESDAEQEDDQKPGAEVGNDEKDGVDEEEATLEEVTFEEGQKRGAGGEDKEADGVEKANEDTDSVAGSVKPKRKPRTDGLFVLPAFQRARFAVGADATIPEGQVPEVFTLMKLIGPLVEETAINTALQIPLQLNVTDPGNEANSASLGTSFFHRIVPEVRRPAEFITLDEAAAFAGLDARYVVPLIFTVATMRFRRVAYVPTALLVRAQPILLRALSCDSGAIVRVATAALGLIHDLLPPLPRYLSNAARLLLLTVPPRQSTRRLKAGHSAFLLLSLAVLRDVTHPLYARVLTILSLGDKLNNVFPMSDLLVSFPNTCISGDPNVTFVTVQKKEAAEAQGVRFQVDGVEEGGRHEKGKKQAGLPAPPHLTWILRVLRHSCVTPTDAELLIKSDIVPLLLNLASLCSGFEHLRRQIFEVLSKLLRTGGSPVGRLLSKRYQLPQWCLFRLQQLMLGESIRSVLAEVVPIADLLLASLRAQAASISGRDKMLLSNLLLSVVGVARRLRLLSPEFLEAMMESFLIVASSSSGTQPLDGAASAKHSLLPEHRELLAEIALAVPAIAQKAQRLLA